MAIKHAVRATGIAFIFIIFNAMMIASLNPSFSDGQLLNPRVSGNMTDYVDQVSDLHSPSDVGTHSSFAAEQSAPDSSYDTITEADISAGPTNYNDYVDQVSNLHSPTDLGTHSSFAEEQDEDVAYDTLTEADGDSSTGNFGKAAGAGTSYTSTVADNLYGGVYTANVTGEIYQASAYLRGGTSVNVKFVITDSSGNILTNGVSGVVAVSSSAGIKTGTWGAGSRPLVTSGTTYWICVVWSAAGRQYYDSTTGATSKSDATNSYTTPTSPTDASSGTTTWRVLTVDVNAINYNIDLEVGWTAAQFSETNEELCVYGGTQDAEAMLVDVWNDGGSAYVNVIADVQAGWNNVSVASYLTDGTFEIRFRTAGSDDLVASTWQVDAVKLHCWSAATPDYELDLEVGWTAIANYSAEYEELCIYGGSQAAEALKVDIWTGSWTNLISDLGTGWNNVSIKSYLSAATCEIRFVDADKASESTQSSWEIDSVLIHTWSTAPTYDTLTESADPLELGATETININVYDSSSISSVVLEYDGANHSMSYISGNNWRYTTWTPTSAGVKNYNIYMVDSYAETSSTGTQSITVQDTTAPTISNVVESADPLEFGGTETITCNVTDLSTLYFVYLEFDGANHSMEVFGGTGWRYNAWTPSSVGVKNYKIWANDTQGNVAQTSGSITVQDTTSPSISSVQESADPLELGATESIECDVTDLSTIYFVYLEFEGSNHSMSYVSGNHWEYTTWTPSTTGVKNYKIWANDTQGNVNFYSGSITVEDTTNPVINNVQESADPLELGSTETIQCDITDESSMFFVYLEFEGANHTMSFVSGITWEYTSWNPITVGNKPYTIWANDTEGNIASYGGSITVEDTTNPVISNVQESADPLEFGSTETIQCDITDLSTPYNYVYIEFDGSNHSMSSTGGNGWEYTSWEPSTTGNHPYTIWVEDSEHNIGHYDGSINVQDTTDPVISNVIESDDPLQLGNNETITCDVTDLSAIAYVYLEFSGTNHTMVFISGIQWKYTNWLPVSAGNYPYIIWVEDVESNIVHYDGSIEVVDVDTKAPEWSNLVEISDPLELGFNITLRINVTDSFGVSCVLLEFDGTNHSMNFIAGNMWEYTNWLPNSVGMKYYTIFTNDTSSNWNNTGQQNFTVQDTTDPAISGVIESADPIELGSSETITCNVTDLSAIDYVYLEFEGINHSMIENGGTGWKYTGWMPGSAGNYPYTIWACDGEGNIGQYSSSIDVIDTDAPDWNNIIEINDPLELGENITIRVNATDLSGISIVYLEFDGTNHSMIFIAGNMWQYSNWQPSSVGIKYYKIYIKDNQNNWNNTGQQDFTVQDTTPANWDNVVEITDPLELGSNITIRINATDLSGIAQVLIEFDGTNHSMNYISGDLWEYANWIPNTVGIKNYVIYIEDDENNWNNTGQLSFQVQDTTPASWDNLVEITDPLEIGSNITLRVNTTDLSGISVVYLEFDGANHTMDHISGNLWEYTDWIPTPVGIKYYTIHVADLYDNWNTTGEQNFTVQDTSPPILSNIVEITDPLALGQNITIRINATDLSGISHVLLEFDGANHTMSHLIDDLWQYADWIPASTGVKYYTIYANDTFNNWINTDLLNFTVTDATPPNWSDLVEITDPLELGSNITIRINVTDASGLSNVLIEFDGTNHTMNYVSGDMWEYSNWIPASASTKYYKIYANDTFNNWNNTGIQSFEVQDTTVPIISDVTESSDPIELGFSVTIRCNVTDLSTISFVYLEFSGSNHSMTYISGVMWEYLSWSPSPVGNAPYKIWTKDSAGNIANITGDVSVVDTISPFWSNIVEITDPLELGSNITICINATDLSGINQILLEFDGVNHSMFFVSGNLWKYTNWIPSPDGVKYYLIYLEDGESNWNVTSQQNFTVLSPSSPVWENLAKISDPLTLGNNIIIRINATDLSGIKEALLEFDGINHSMNYVSGNMWSYNSWTPASIGVKQFIIYIKDNLNNLNNTGLQNFTVITVPSEPESLIGMEVAGFIQVELMWAAPLSDGGSPVIGYYIYRGGMGEVVVLIDTVYTTTYEDTDVKPATSYFYEVRAFNVAGEGPAAKLTITLDPPVIPLVIYGELDWIIYLIIVLMAIIIIILLIWYSRKRRPRFRRRIRTVTKPRIKPKMKMKARIKPKMKTGINMKMRFIR